jgi:DNA-binding IclR family transcriptional regulator
MVDVLASLGIPKSTACELMRVVAAEGLVAPTKDGRFAHGRRLHERGSAYSVQVNLLHEGHPHHARPAQ